MTPTPKLTSKTKTRTPKRADPPSPPPHLTPESAEWWNEINASYQLQSYQLKILTAAAEALDVANEAAAALRVNGLTWEDRYGQVKKRPEVEIELTHKALFARLLRELCLDSEAPRENRPPRPRY